MATATQPCPVEQAGLRLVNSSASSPLAPSFLSGSLVRSTEYVRSRILTGSNFHFYLSSGHNQVTSHLHIPLLPQSIRHATSLLPHFYAPNNTEPALDVYRSSFQASEVLDEPYVQSIVFGASSRANIQNTIELINEKLGEPA